MEIIKEVKNLKAQFNNVELNIDWFRGTDKEFDIIERTFGCYIDQKEFWERLELAKEQGMRYAHFSLYSNGHSNIPMFHIEL